MKASERIRELRKQKGWSQEDLAHKLGYNHRSMVSRLELGETRIDEVMIRKLSDIFNVSPTYIVFGVDDKKNDNLDFHAMGEVAAGYGKEARQEFVEDEYLSVPKDIIKGYSKEDFIYLTVSGDSMFPYYQDGDRLLILRTPQCENGAIAVVQYGEEQNGTLKKVYFEGSAVRLKPLNPDYDEIVIKGSELDCFKIVGVPKFLARAI